MPGPTLEYDNWYPFVRCAWAFDLLLEYRLSIYIFFYVGIFVILLFY